MKAGSAVGFVVLAILVQGDNVLRDAGNTGRAVHRQFSFRSLCTAVPSSFAETIGRRDTLLLFNNSSATRLVNLTCGHKSPAV